MSRKILGLDIGVKYLRAVGLAAGGRRPRIYAAETVEVHDGDIPAALGELRARGIDCDVCASAIPAGMLSLRNIQMPFRDERKIRQTIAFELEPVIPYPIEEAVIDFMITSPEEPAGVLAAVATRALIRERIQLIEAVFPEATYIDMEGMPLARAIAGKAPDECVLLIEAGPERPVGIIMDRGRVLLVRPFDGGLEDIPGENRVPHEGAAGRKAAAAFAREAKAALDMARLSLTGDLPHPARIILNGAGALLPVLQDELRSAFNVPVEVCDLTAQEDFDIDPAAAPWTLDFNSALALALRAGKRSAGLDFRRGEFELQKHVLQLRRDLKWAAIMATVGATVLLAGQGAGYYLDYVKLNRLKAAVTGVFKASCPEVTKIVDPVQQLKTKISEARKASLGTGTPFLVLLQDINGAVLPSSPLLITNLVYDGERIEIKAETGSFEMAEDIKKALAASGRFRNITISSAAAARQGSKVEFSLKMDISK